MMMRSRCTHGRIPLRTGIHTISKSEGQFVSTVSRFVCDL
jgi:hypothetical protein